MTILSLLLILGSFIVLWVFLFQYVIVLSAFSYSFKLLILCFLSLSISSFIFCISLFIGIQFHIFMLAVSLSLVFFSRLAKKSTLPSVKNLLPNVAITGKHIVIAVLLLLYTRNFFLESERWGNWDAWAIWNLHAKFLSFNHEWQQMFSIRIAQWTHSDYPLFLSSLIAFVWKSTGIFEPYTPILIAYLIAIAIPFVLYASIPSAHQSVLGSGFLIILLIDFNFLSIAVSQGADTLLALFYLISLICFYYQEADHRIAFLTGFFGATCSWIKNEGLLFYLVVSIFFVCMNYGNRKLIYYFILGSVLPLGILVFYKTKYSPGNDLVQNQSIKTLKYLFTPSRYLYIGKYIINTIFLKFPVLLPCVIISVYLGIRKREFMLFAILTTVLTGYFFVYLTTPHDLYWHLSTSCERLIHQLYPSLLFLFGNIIVANKHLLSGLVHQPSDSKV